MGKRVYKGRYDLTLYDENLEVHLEALRALLQRVNDFDYWLQVADYGEQMFVGAMLYFYEADCMALQKEMGD